MTSYLPHALRALEHGLCPIPVHSDGTKRPALNSWTIYETRRPTQDELLQWFVVADYRNRAAGIGYLCGSVSGNLEMLEVEGRFVDALPDIIERLQLAGLGDVFERIDAGYRERSPSGGIHWLYRIDGKPAPANQRLAARPNGNRVDVLIETRGEGGFVVVAPTGPEGHRDLHKPWVLERGDIDTIATITADEHDSLHAIMRSFDERVEPHSQITLAQPISHHTGISLEQRPGDIYNSEYNWHDVLEPQGWTHLFTHNGVDYWRRPGKTGRSVSATTNSLGTDRLKVFSTSTPFDTETTYDKFGAYALLHHAGNVSAAARDLRPPPPLSSPMPGATGAQKLAQPLSENPDATDDDPNPLEQALQSFADLANVPPLDPLINGILFTDTLAMVYGDPGGGKTFLALDWALSVSAGIPWFGKTVKHGEVLYMTAEGKRGLWPRVQAWMKHHNIDTVPPAKLYADTVNLRDAVFVNNLIKLATKLKPILIVLDTLARSTPGADENSTQDMGYVIAVADQVRRASGGCVLFVHHKGKGAVQPRGSTALTGAMDTIVSVSRQADIITISNTAPQGKQKDAPEFQDILAKMQAVNLTENDEPTSSVTLIPHNGVSVSWSDMKKACRDAGRCLTVPQIAQTVNCSEDQVKLAIQGNLKEWNELADVLDDYPGKDEPF